MCPELNWFSARELSKDEIKRGKFIREGNVVWVDGDLEKDHTQIAEEAGFQKPDDAGSLYVESIDGTKNTIIFFGGSSTLHINDDPVEREKTIAVSQEAVGDAATVLQRDIS